MQSDLGAARRHMEQARDILGHESDETRRLREAIDLAIEAILHMEHRRRDEQTNVIWFPFSRVRRRMVDDR